MKIIRGTTPSLIYTFDKVEVTDITVAFFSVVQGKESKITKTLSDALVSDGNLIFTLTQEDTLSLMPNSKARVFLDWKTSAGLRGRANIYDALVENSGKEEVI